MKTMMRWMTVLVALCLLITPAAAENPAETEALPEPTPWTGDGHWYTFQIIGDSGLISSTNVRYIPLYDYYYVDEDTAVAIGKVKGMASEIRVWTNDPEERVIWSASPNGFRGIFARSGYRMPESGNPANGDPVLCVAGEFRALSAEAQAELYALRDSVRETGEPFGESGCGIDPDGQMDAWVCFKYHEIPGLGVWMEMCLTRYEGRLLLLSWDNGGETGDYQPDYILDIDPESELYRAFYEFLQASGQEE